MEKSIIENSDKTEKQNKQELNSATPTTESETSFEKESLFLRQARLAFIDVDEFSMENVLGDLFDNKF